MSFLILRVFSNLDKLCIFLIAVYKSIDHDIQNRKCFLFYYVFDTTYAKQSWLTKERFFYWLVTLIENSLWWWTLENINVYALSIEVMVLCKVKVEFKWLPGMFVFCRCSLNTGKKTVIKMSCLRNINILIYI